MSDDRWNKLIKRYAIGHRSDMDMSVGVARLIDNLRLNLPGVEIGYDAAAHFYRDPLKYLYIGNKVTGPNNKPFDKDVHNISQKQNRFEALTECELTFWHNKENSIRFRYFIQLTHGHMIHGVSWVKYDSEFQYGETDFDPVRKLVTNDFLSDESEPDTGSFKKTYGIWDGGGKRVGLMRNHLVKGFGGNVHVMDDKAIAKMLYLMNRAYSFFKENEQRINELINNKSKQQ